MGIDILVIVIHSHWGQWEREKRNSLKYTWIKENKYIFSIALMCKIINVDVSSYYRWVHNGSIVQKVDKQLNEIIKSIFIQGRSKYGTHRIQDKLLPH